jgi:hypothetical protein
VAAAAAAVAVAVAAAAAASRGNLASGHRCWGCLVTSHLASTSAISCYVSSSPAGLSLELERPSWIVGTSGALLVHCTNVGSGGPEARARRDSSGLGATRRARSLSTQGGGRGKAVRGWPLVCVPVLDRKRERERGRDGRPAMGAPVARGKRGLGPHTDHCCALCAVPLYTAPRSSWHCSSVDTRGQRRKNEQGAGDSSHGGSLLDNGG